MPHRVTEDELSRKRAIFYENVGFFNPVFMMDGGTLMNARRRRVKMHEAGVKLTVYFILLNFGYQMLKHFVRGNERE